LQSGCSSARVKTFSSEKQKGFLDEILKEGERTGVKANPDTVALTMRKASKK